MYIFGVLIKIVVQRGEPSIIRIQIANGIRPSENVINVATGNVSEIVAFVGSGVKEDPLCVLLDGFEELM